MNNKNIDWLSIPWGIVSENLSLKDSLKLYNISKFFHQPEYDQEFSLIYAQLYLKDRNFWKKSMEIISSKKSVIDGQPLENYFQEICHIEKIRLGDENYGAEFFYPIIKNMHYLIFPKSYI